MEYTVSLRKNLWLVRKSDAPVKKELFNNLLEIIQASIDMGATRKSGKDYPTDLLNCSLIRQHKYSLIIWVAPKHCFHRIFQRWGRGPLYHLLTIQLVQQVVLKTMGNP